MKAVEDAFFTTTRLLFGKGLSGLGSYEGWLTKRLPSGSLHKSCASGKMVYVPSHTIFPQVPKDRVAGLDSLEALMARKISIGENDGIREISRKLPDISYYVAELAEGRNLDVAESTIYNDLYSAYRIVDCFYSKKIAYDFFTDYNESTFGCAMNFHSKFSIHCYNSKNVNNSFEADACTNCSGVMFCHNCEHVFDSLFCFNLKDKRYAILNKEVGREEFLRVKGILCAYLVKNLEEKKSLPFDIFDLA